MEFIANPVGTGDSVVYDICEGEHVPSGQKGARVPVNFSPSRRPVVKDHTQFSTAADAAGTENTAKNKATKSNTRRMFASESLRSMMILMNSRCCG